MAVVLDAGAFISLERGGRRMHTVVKVALTEGTPLRTSAAVVAQVWRGSSRQAVLAMALRSVDVVALDGDAAAEVGVLLARSGTGDVVDAHVITLCAPGDVVVTSDPEDLTRLAQAREARVLTV